MAKCLLHDGSVSNRIESIDQCERAHFLLNMQWPTQFVSQSVHNKIIKSVENGQRKIYFFASLLCRRRYYIMVVCRSRFCAYFFFASLFSTICPFSSTCIERRTLLYVQNVHRRAGHRGTRRTRSTPCTTTSVAKYQDTINSHSNVNIELR